jgi:hypothetical protein
VEPGDIVIYALPEAETNFKHAAVNILWNGKPMLLSNITHTSRPRLDLAIKEHKSLWGIRILINRGVADSSIEALVKQRCDLEFVTSRAELERCRREYYERLVGRRLQEQSAQIPPNAGEYARKVREVVTELSRQAKDDRPWRKRLDAVINKVFGS